MNLTRIQMVAALTESEYQVGFSLIDTNGQSNDGHVELSIEVTIAIIDGKSML